MYPLYNVTADEAADKHQALEAIKRRAYEEGRKAGFIAGYAAATSKAPNDVEAAYQQGYAAGRGSLFGQASIRKNGVGY